MAYQNSSSLDISTIIDVKAAESVTPSDRVRDPAVV
jgi:hypothetical protein